MILRTWKTNWMEAYYRQLYGTTGYSATNPYFKIYQYTKRT